MNNSTLTIKIKTLTPLWTGGVDGTMDRIHETGIIGSLRWWYEAIVRGLGGSACDPTEGKCSFDAEKYRKSKATDERQRLRDAGLCDVCQVFGATGWQRRFKLEIRPIEGEFDITEGMFPSGRIHPDKRKPYRTGGWLMHGGYHGTVELKFIGDEKILWCEILPVLLFMEKWGALGPKTSLGYGVFEVLSINGLQKKAEQSWRTFLQKSDYNFQNCSGLVGQWWWGKHVPSNAGAFRGILPALTNMFFAKVRFSPEQKDWWEHFPEILWLREGGIPPNEAKWTGDEAEPTGTGGPSNDHYTISRPLPIERIRDWVKNHSTFPIAPMLRTRLRYGSHTICHGNGETDWCKFVFGTVKGGTPVCGYCGAKVHADKSNPRRKWCKNGKVSLSDSEVIRDAKRIQSKIRVSWAYQQDDGEWEVRIWGWLPKDHRQNSHEAQRQAFLQSLRRFLGVSATDSHRWHTAHQNDQLWAEVHIPNPEVCWFEKEAAESTEEYLKALRHDCDNKTE